MKKLARFFFHLLGPSKTNAFPYFYIYLVFHIVGLALGILSTFKILTNGLCVFKHMQTCCIHSNDTHDPPIEKANCSHCYLMRSHYLNEFTETIVPVQIIYDWRMLKIAHIICMVIFMIKIS